MGPAAAGELAIDVVGGADEADVGECLGEVAEMFAGGAEFLVVICGEIMTMPGLPREPAAHQIRLDEAGLIQGLF